MSLGSTELVIILAIVMMLFGGSQLPKLARSFGQAKREFEEGGKAAADPVSPDRV